MFGLRLPLLPFSVYSKFTNFRENFIFANSPRLKTFRVFAATYRDGEFTEKAGFHDVFAFFFGGKAGRGWGVFFA